MKRLKRRARRDDAGFTLIELVITIAIMAIITIPLGNFMLQYLTTYNDTQTRLSDSHDMQIAAAYFSQDVGNTGLRDAVTTTPKQSIWIPAAPPAPGGFPTTYCGSSLGGTTLLLLGWDDWSDVAQTGSDSIDSVSVFHPGRHPAPGLLLGRHNDPDQHYGAIKYHRRLQHRVPRHRKISPP